MHQVLFSDKNKYSRHRIYGFDLDSYEYTATIMIFVYWGSFKIPWKINGLADFYTTTLIKEGNWEYFYNKKI